MNKRHMLWHGVLTAPPAPTAGLPRLDAEETGGPGSGMVRTPCHNTGGCRKRSLKEVLAQGNGSMTARRFTFGLLLSATLMLAGGGAIAAPAPAVAQVSIVAVPLDAPTPEKCLVLVL